ncbi:MFS transporter [Saccharopolyspora dendranthemae]|uniref:EmrB/QacA subfamily drug resistance transporter n=1 Tax=Saccharopolyspora dendranthemae TaxID=1181886 RepID=A0A561V8M5_9PSEU|nr:MFS transporter [Saccharopolyspora dendranthemae]TWG07953.1 EmrB/QacA subfamily drug resistance transporter [Saccharopolyspora dendranthemae]
MTRRAQDASGSDAAVPAAEDEREVRRRCRRALGVTTLGLMLVLVNTTSLNLALPALSASFQVPAATADWFLVAFMLSNTASILVFSRISDMLGRRTIYLAGLVCFTTISLLCAFAPNATALIVLRALQGIAAATTVTNTTAILTDVFPSDRLVRGLSLNITAASIAQMIGPALGGLLVTFVGWQALFLVNVPIGILAVALGARLLPKLSRTRGPEERFDVAGAALSSTGLAVLLFGINRIGPWGAADPRVWTAILLGIALLVAFVLVELRISAPLLDFQLVRRPGRGQAYGAAFFNSFCRAGVVVLVGLHQQMVEHRTALEAGFIVMPLALLMMLCAPLSGRLSSRWSARTLSSLGAVLVVLGIVGLAGQLATAGAPLLLMTLWLGLIGGGTGLFTAPNTGSIMAGVSSDRRAVANGIRSMLFNSAQAAGTAVALLILTSWLGSSGVASYAANADDSTVRLGFAVAAGAMGLAALSGLVLSLARGGPWRAR